MSLTEFVRILRWLEDTRSFEEFKVEISGEDWNCDIHEIRIDFIKKSINIIGESINNELDSKSTGSCYRIRQNKKEFDNDQEDEAYFYA